MTKWDSVRRSFDRAHSDLFSRSEYQATFYNYPDPTTGDYDPNTGEIDEGSRSQFAQFHVEFVPPGMDTTVDVDGTSFSWDSSIRFPQDKVSQGDLVPLGEDNERPTEVDLSDPNDANATTYQLHGYTTEQGSQMYMCRLIEQ